MISFLSFIPRSVSTWLQNRKKNFWRWGQEFLLCCAWFPSWRSFPGIKKKSFLAQIFSWGFAFFTFLLIYWTDFDFFGLVEILVLEYFLSFWKNVSPLTSKSTKFYLLKFVQELFWRCQKPLTLLKSLKCRKLFFWVDSTYRNNSQENFS